MSWKADDIITTDRYLAAFPNDYFKTDVFYTGPCFWRGKVAYLPKPWQSLIVVGHSDYCITEEIANRYPKAKWYCVNKQTTKVNGLPLGITNDCADGDVHRIFGNIPMMVEVASQPREIRNLMYINFEVWTYPAERLPILERFQNESWVTHEKSVISMEGRKHYLQSVRNHTFVACPRGNGIDTHRLWETLYMGSIPIVKKDLAHSDWLDLPVLWIDDWNQLNEQYLREQEIVIRSREWNMEKLKVGYWIKKISQK
jgi:hypothetical protein